MKSIIYVFIILVALSIPSERMDVGKLKPVGLLCVYEESGKVIIMTDTDDYGIGENVDETIKNLEGTTAGKIYLDTADYLLVKEGGEHLIGEMGPYLDPSVKLCRFLGKIEPKQAHEYLQTHEPEISIYKWKTSENLTTIEETNGRIRVIN